MKPPPQQLVLPHGMVGQWVQPSPNATAQMGAQHAGAPVVLLKPAPPVLLAPPPQHQPAQQSRYLQPASILLSSGIGYF